MKTEIMVQDKKYQRCLVMAGGGFHFGYYLAIHAALCEAGQAPDLLLASCGGAIAAALIQNLADVGERRNWLASPQMYDFWRSVQSTRHARVTHAFGAAMQRRFLGHQARYVPDLFEDYMFEIPPQLPLPPMASTSQVAVAIVAGKLNFGVDAVGSLRAGRKLFSEVVFCPERAAGLVRGMTAPLSHALYGDNTIAADILTDVEMPLADAVRASISDMYYFRCHRHPSGDYLGGVVDLFPIEMAHRLADSVVMERKGGYDKTYDQPALRTVLGFDGNLRLNQVLAQPADYWVNTADMEQVLRQQRIYQKIIWLRNRIEIAVPGSFAQYVQIIDAQWAFGYQRGRMALGLAAGACC